MREWISEFRNMSGVGLIDAKGAYDANPGKTPAEVWAACGGKVPRQLATVESENADLRAEVERLTRERDELRVGIHDALRQIQGAGSPPSVPLGAFVAHYARLIRERAEAAERKLKEAREENEESRALLRRVYLILANVENQWPSRFSREGQALLCRLRDATGGYPGEENAALGEGEKVERAADEPMASDMGEEGDK